MIRLGINVDHVATVRNARGEFYPSPIQAATLCILGGADNITCHLREDRRHIKDADVTALKENIQVPLNFEMAATEEMISFAEKLRPHAVTIVPEKREELTTEGGLDVRKYQHELKEQVARLRESGILVSMFVDPNEDAIEATLETNAEAVEIHTGDLCTNLQHVRTTQEQWDLLRPFQESARIAKKAGLQVHVGHGLNYQNAQWLQTMPEVEEANIGHAVVARSIFVGLEKAVREMKELINNPIYAPKRLSE